MPELPEVEVCRRGLLPELIDSRIDGIRMNDVRLRQPLAPELRRILTGRRIVAITRRSKYLLLACSTETDKGYLIIHLGMSGHLHFVQPDLPPQRHDHFDLQTSRHTLRFTDPRRFGLVVWHPDASPETHPLLSKLGIEPLSDEFDGARLYAALQTRSAPVKNILMDAHTVVGIGNIYAAESLFYAGISPCRAANRINQAEAQRLVDAISQTLRHAIAAGGSSIRNYRHSDGSQGYFQLECAVYGREGQPCRRCGATIKKTRQAGRSSFYCPVCQR